jgi:hypothetical protein
MLKFDVLFCSYINFIYILIAVRQVHMKKSRMLVTNIYIYKLPFLDLEASMHLRGNLISWAI